MTAAPCYVGIIVRDLDISVAWYAKTLGCDVGEQEPSWASLHLRGGSRVELHVGDPESPGLTFPSYGGEPGPPVMPGFSVEDPDELAAGLQVARHLPEWIVVVAPDRLRIVLTHSEQDERTGLAGFRWVSPDRASQVDFLHRIGVNNAEVVEGDSPGVTPAFRADRLEQLTDPDGTRLLLVNH